jgi:exosortase A
MGFVWLVADLVNIQIIKQGAVVGMLTGGFWTILGNRIASKIMFPLVYLFFMVPAGGEFVRPLMEFTASFSVFLIRLTGIPDFREGLNLTLTSGQWTVAEACSGINYLIASISIGLVYAYITFSSYWKRAVFVLVSMIAPILANGIRAFLIVMLGHFSNMTLAVGVDHIIYGAVFFGLVMMLLFYLGSFWKDPPLIEEACPGSAMPFANRPFYSALLLMGLFYVVWPMGSAWLSKKQPTPAASEQDLKLALAKKDWQAVENPQWAWSPQFNGATVESIVYFSHGQAIFGLYEASFGQETQGGAELVNSQNVLVTAEQRKSWKVIQTGTMQLADNGKLLTADQTVISGSGRSLVILSWYKIGAHETADPYRAKWLQLLKRLSNDTSPELQVVLLAEAPGDDYQQAQAAIKNVAQHWLD